MKKEKRNSRNNKLMNIFYVISTLIIFTGAIQKLTHNQNGNLILLIGLILGFILIAYEIIILIKSKRKI